MPQSGAVTGPVVTGANPATHTNWVAAAFFSPLNGAAGAGDARRILSAPHVAPEELG
ncbi:hypothetical protein [Nocardia sp. CA-145437]|uniref:hypothetical protein n=1 Tax=Nocardia sp. CA-145437 TaxID=3239980 RepID=UPI003D9979D9